MKLYTSKVVAQWLGLTERRVRQLRDEGVIAEARPGLYDLQPTVAKYITYIGGAGKESLTQERTKLTKANGRRRSWRTSCAGARSIGPRTSSGGSRPCS